jgi:hypothetical protein
MVLLAISCRGSEGDTAYYAEPAFSSAEFQSLQQEAATLDAIGVQTMVSSPFFHSYFYSGPRLLQASQSSCLFEEIDEVTDVKVRDNEYSLRYELSLSDECIDEIRAERQDSIESSRQAALGPVIITHRMEIPRRIE